MTPERPKCEFNAAICTQECKKYSMCSYQAIQNQFREIQEQINFLLSTILNLSSIIQQPSIAENQPKENLEVKVPGSRGRHKIIKFEESEPMQKEVSDEEDNQNSSL